MAASTSVVWKFWPVLSCIVAVLSCASVLMILDYYDKHTMEDLQSRINRLENDIELLSAKASLNHEQSSDTSLLESPSGFYDENQRVRRDAEVTRSKGRRKGTKRRKGRPKNKCKICENSMSLDAVHFTADGLTDNTTMSNHHGDGEVYDFWKPLKFGEGHPRRFLRPAVNMSSYTITKSGLYFIYAQILYHDQSGRYAYGIYIDDKLTFQCTQTQTVAHAPSDLLPQDPMFVQCHTGAALYINKGQVVCIKGLYKGRQVLRIGEATFWGIVKFSSV